MNKKVFHILVVDDDDRIRELVKEYLEENNFLVTTAKDAADAKQWEEYYARKRAEEDKEEYNRKFGSRPGRAGHIPLGDGTFVNP